MGACAADGVFVCNDDGDVTCNAQIGQAGVERCNGIDDDCDGNTDERLVQACGSNVGECSQGIETCANGRFGECEGSVGPALEVCDTRDNDCNGRVDDGILCEEQPVVCEGQLTPPCNGCPQGTVVDPGFVCVPEGFFFMGSTPRSAGHESSEDPRHGVYLTPYLMSAREITFDQYINHAATEQRNVALTCQDAEDGPCPVVGVSLAEAVFYANGESLVADLDPCYDISRCFPDRETGVMTCCIHGQNEGCGEIAYEAQYAEDPTSCPGYRLPHEAEWEYAARAGDNGLFFFSLENGRQVDPRPILPAYANATDAEAIMSVGSLRANPLGLYDIYGNVAEWTDSAATRYPDLGGANCEGFWNECLSAYDDVVSECMANDRTQWECAHAGGAQDGPMFQLLMCAIECGQPAANPQTTPGSERIIRGCRAGDGESRCRSAARFSTCNGPDCAVPPIVTRQALGTQAHDPVLGFRLVRSVNADAAERRGLGL